MWKDWAQYLKNHNSYPSNGPKIEKPLYSSFIFSFSTIFYVKPLQTARTHPKFRPSHTTSWTHLNLESPSGTQTSILLPFQPHLPFLMNKRMHSMIDPFISLHENPLLHIHKNFDVSKKQTYPYALPKIDIYHSTTSPTDYVRATKNV